MRQKSLIIFSILIFTNILVFAGDQEEAIWGITGENSSYWMQVKENTDPSAKNDCFYNFTNETFDAFGMYFKGSYINIGPKDDNWLRSQLNFGYFIQNGMFHMVLKTLTIYDKDRNIISTNNYGDEVVSYKYSSVIAGSNSSIILDDTFLILVN